MKTQKSGLASRTQTSAFAVFLVLPVYARLEYRESRENGEKEGDLPGDGKYTWIKGRVEGEDVYGLKESDGYYHYELRYDEGPKDKEWMEEGDWEYIQGLMRTGKLLQVEPNADKEIAPDHKYRAEITRALREARGDVDLDYVRALLRTGPAPIPRPRDSFEIPFTAIEFGRQLGVGGFGVVYQAQLSTTHLTVAVKRLQIGAVPADETTQLLADFKREVTMMKDLRHPNIVSIYNACFEEPSRYCFTMEYMPRGSLLHLFEASHPYSWKQRWQIALDVSSGILYLHNRDIKHRDIKSANVLLDEHDRAKISDFGLSRERPDSRRTVTTVQMVGTIPWMAPELFRDERYTSASDVYSVGMVLWEIAAWSTPYKAVPPMMIIPHVLSGKREKIPSDCPKSYAKLIGKCWDGRREKRPNMEEVMEKLESKKAKVGL